MTFYLATGEAVKVEELIGRTVTVVWRDPYLEWSGNADTLPSTVECRTHGKFLGSRAGPVGQEIAIAAEDVSDDGDWRAATAIPVGVVVQILPLTAEPGLFTTRSAKP